MKILYLSNLYFLHLKEMLYCRHLTILIHFLGLGIGIAHCTLRLLIVFRVGAYTNNKDRPTKHSLSLSKLTNHSSEWKVG